MRLQPPLPPRDPVGAWGSLEHIEKVNIERFLEEMLIEVHPQENSDYNFDVLENWNADELKELLSMARERRNELVGKRSQMFRVLRDEVEVPNQDAPPDQDSDQGYNPTDKLKDVPVIAENEMRLEALIKFIEKKIGLPSGEE